MISRALLELHERISDLLQRARRRGLSGCSLLLREVRHGGKAKVVPSKEILRLVLAASLCHYHTDPSVHHLLVGESVRVSQAVLYLCRHHYFNEFRLGRSRFGDICDIEYT